MYDARLAGHLGKGKTRERTLQCFYWFGVQEDASNWVTRYDSCASIKPPLKSLKALLGAMMLGWAPISWDPYHWYPEATNKFWWWLIIAPSGLKYSLFPTRLQRHVLVLSWMRSLPAMVALMRFTAIREEIMKVGSSLSSVDCLRCARQGPHQETHDVTARLRDLTTH